MLEIGGLNTGFPALCLNLVASLKNKSCKLGGKSVPFACVSSSELVAWRPVAVSHDIVVSQWDPACLMKLLYAHTRDMAVTYCKAFCTEAVVRGSRSIIDIFLFSNEFQLFSNKPPNLFQQWSNDQYKFSLNQKPKTGILNPYPLIRSSKPSPLIP